APPQPADQARLRGGSSASARALLASRSLQGRPSPLQHQVNLTRLLPPFASRGPPCDGPRGFTGYRVTAAVVATFSGTVCARGSFPRSRRSFASSSTASG